MGQQWPVDGQVVALWCGCPPDHWPSAAWPAPPSPCWRPGGSPAGRQWPAGPRPGPGSEGRRCAVALPGEPRGCHTQCAEGLLQLAHPGIRGEVPNLNRAERHRAQFWWGQVPRASGGTRRAPGPVPESDVLPSLLLSVAQASEDGHLPQHLTADLEKQSSSSYSQGVSPREEASVMQEPLPHVLAEDSAPSGQLSPSATLCPPNRTRHRVARWLRQTKRRPMQKRS